MIALNKKTFFLSILFAVAIASMAVNVFLVVKISESMQICRQNQVNMKVLAFRDMFSEKILLATSDVDFDTRLELETAVRNLRNNEIFAQWQKFTKCETKEQATIEAKNLLALLIKNTAY